MMLLIKKRVELAVVNFIHKTSRANITVSTSWISHKNRCPANLNIKCSKALQWLDFISLIDDPMLCYAVCVTFCNTILSSTSHRILINHSFLRVRDREIRPRGQDSWLRSRFLDSESWTRGGISLSNTSLWWMIIFPALF